MTTEEKNKKLHEVLGLRWHERRLFPYRMCSCGVFDCQECNADFYTDAGTVQLMRKLEKWEHGKLFFACILYASNFGPVEANDDDGFVERYSITTTGLLADKLIEWRNNGNNN